MFSSIWRNILFKKRASSAYFSRCSSLKQTSEPPNPHFSQSAPKLAVSAETVFSNVTKGIENLRNPRLNKGLRFTLDERKTLGIHGLLPSEFRTLEQQMAICRLSLDRYRSLLNKYIYLSDLQDTNETLFYTLIQQDLQKYMPLIDSPTVGMASQRFGLIYNRCKGLFVSIHDKGHVIDVLKNWPERNVRAIVVTDGERVLGHGDQGAHGICVSHGKATLLTALAGINPHQCLPVCLDTGTNNKMLLDDPLYIGVRENRCSRSSYDDLVGEFMSAVKTLFGPRTVVVMENFATNNAHRVLNLFRDEYCLFNDDVQATAAAVVGGLMAACQNITNQKLRDQTYLFVGAGATGVGIANLLCDAMVEEGASWASARNKCYLFDVNGLLTQKAELELPLHVRNYIRDVDPEPNLIKCIAKFKITCLIGTTASRGMFTPPVLKEVAKNTERPLIFALSNPNSLSECTAQEAYKNTNGRCIFASGSPFSPVLYKGQRFYTGQANSYFIFPGVTLGVIAANASRVTDAMFLSAAKTLASNVREEDIKVGRIYPPVNNIYSLSKSIAANIVSYACAHELSYLYPKPQDFKKFIDKQTYEFKQPSDDPSTTTDKKDGIKLRNIEFLHSSILRGRTQSKRRKPRNKPTSHDLFNN